MRIIAVDDESIILTMLENEIRSAVPKAEVAAFTDPEDALHYAETNEVDVAFLDIRLGTMDGVELAKEIKEQHPFANIVFCTGYSEYMPEAFQIRASDYLLKPVTAEKIRHAMDSLRHPPKFNIPQDKLYIRCFGRFEVYYQDRLLENIPKRAKELLAYLVYRHGAMCSTREVMSSVFIKLSESYFRVARMDLEGVLREIGQEDVLKKQWGKVGIDTEKIVCDWYEYTDGNPEAINLYDPKFMEPYWWAKAEAPCT